MLVEMLGCVACQARDDGHVVIVLFVGQVMAVGLLQIFVAQSGYSKVT